MVSDLAKWAARMAKYEERDEALSLSTIRLNAIVLVHSIFLQYHRHELDMKHALSRPEPRRVFMSENAWEHLTQFTYDQRLASLPSLSTPSLT